MLDGGGKRTGARRVILLLTDGEQTYSFCYQPIGKGRKCGTEAAIAMAGDVQPQVDTVFSIGFGGVLDKTVNALASAPSSENAYRADDIQQLMNHFANFCSFLQPKPPPPPSPPPLPPLPPPPPMRPPPPPAPCWCTKTGVCTPLLKVSSSSRCGRSYGACSHSTSCCSKWNWCGRSSAYCGSGSQAAYSS